MASNRIGRINEEIQKELSSLIRNLKDPRVQDTMISITRVETTPDLRFAKVYASFLQEDRAADALKGLQSASGYLRRELGSAPIPGPSPKPQQSFPWPVPDNWPTVCLMSAGLPIRWLSECPGHH